MTSSSSSSPLKWWRLLPLAAMALTFILLFFVHLPGEPSMSLMSVSSSSGSGGTLGIAKTNTRKPSSSYGTTTSTVIKAPPAEVWMDNPDEGTNADKRKKKKKSSKLPPSVAKRVVKQKEAAAVAVAVKEKEDKERADRDAAADAAAAQQVLASLTPSRYNIGIVSWGKPRTPVWTFIVGQCPCQLPALGSDAANRMGLTRQVEVTCEASTNRKQLDVVSIDVSLIWQVSHLPVKMHRWLCVQREPESNTPFFEEWRSKCDWIASFRRNSPITILADTRTATELQRIPRSTQTTDASLPAICAFISNCGRSDQPDTLARVTWLQQLQQHIDVDSFGLCANNADEMKWQQPEEMSTILMDPTALKKRIMPHYRFALVIESSLSDPDYITDQVYHVLDAGIIPIYRGGASISSYLPANSFINANELSPGEVAERVQRLIATPSLYDAMFNWKTTKNLVLGRDKPIPSNHTHNGADAYHSGLCEDGSFRCTVCSMYVHEQLKKDGVIL